MLKRSPAKYVLLLMVWSASTIFLFSQENNQPNLQRIKLVDWLQQLEQAYEVSFSYNASLLDHLLLEYSNDCKSLKGCINAIKRKAPLTFELRGENNYFVLPIRSNIQFKAIGIENNEPVIPLHIQVNDQSEIYMFPDESIYTIQNLFLLDSVHIRSDFHRTVHFLASDLQALKGILVLEPKIIPLNEVTIRSYLTQGVTSKVSDHSMHIRMKSLGLLAGETDSDVFNVLKNIPGIRTPDGKPGSLNFRGSSFDQNLILIDDIPIYHSGHYFGTLSPYNSMILDNIEIQRNTLTPNWGGRVGGLINMVTETIVPDSTSYDIRVNTLYAGAAARTSILKDKLGLTLSGRFNFPNYQSQKLEAFSSLNFQGSKLEPIAVNTISASDVFKTKFHDINAKLIYDIDENHKITSSFINILNRFSAVFNSENQNLIESQDVKLDNWGVSTKWEAQLSNKFSTSLRISRSSLRILDSNEITQNELPTNIEKSINNLDDTRFVSEASYVLDSKTRFEAGYTLTNHQIFYDELIDENQSIRQTNQKALIHSFYANSNINWSKRIITNIGVRTDYYEPLATFYVDPRISLSISATNALFFKASGGRSHQFIQQRFKNDFDDFRVDNQFWFLPDNTASILEGYQGMVGALYNRSGWLADLELYQRTTNNITRQLTPGTDQNGRIVTRGADLFLKKRWRKLETWISYSLSKVETEFEEVTTEAFFNQRHILNITGLLNLRQWGIAVSWGYSTGMPVNIPAIDPDFNDGQTTLTIPYSNRFPAQHQLDASATYKFWNKSKNWRGMIGLSFVNLYNQENIINIFQNNTKINNPYRTAVGFAPNLQVNLSF